jgi:7,8-dihydropterin-6-yl-methyl-4-(beta-D-ribofuranosyl)aminobenzene 5'-phosphate synthase
LPKYQQVGYTKIIGGTAQLLDMPALAKDLIYWDAFGNAAKMKAMLSHHGICCLLVVGAAFIFSSPQESACEGESTMKNKIVRPTPAAAQGLDITVVYDNYAHTAGLQTGWGFSCLIQGLDHTILFDTGGDGAVLLENMRRLGIDPIGIDVIFLSHNHGDHTGGLAALLRTNPHVKVCFPQTFPAALKRTLAERGVRIQAVAKPVEITRSACSSGILGNGIPEQSLFVVTDAGTIVITGCAHPGIVRILKEAEELIGDAFLLVMGGFHLGGASGPQLAQIAAEFKTLDVKSVGPCHCSGDLTRKIFKEMWAGAYETIGVGRRIGFDDHVPPAVLPKP